MRNYIRKTHSIRARLSRRVLRSVSEGITSPNKKAPLKETFFFSTICLTTYDDAILIKYQNLLLKFVTGFGFVCCDVCCCCCFSVSLLFVGRGFMLTPVVSSCRRIERVLEVGTQSHSFSTYCLLFFLQRFQFSSPLSK